MEFFMIAIDVAMTPKNIADIIDRDIIIQMIVPSYQHIYDFFKNCIDQNVLLNVAAVSEEPSVNVTTYFATTIENAQAFEQVFSDMSAEFSIKKFWSQHDFDISISHHEIDFDTVDDTFELIGPRGEIWGQTF
jgi:hypothetical protein